VGVVFSCELAADTCNHDSSQDNCPYCQQRHTKHVPCDAGDYYCSGSCYQVSCATVARLKAATPPSILLSLEAQTTVTSSLTLVLPYGIPVVFNLLPCPSSGRSATYSLFLHCEREGCESPKGNVHIKKSTLLPVILVT